jgi:hypothetical protein
MDGTRVSPPPPNQKVRVGEALMWSYKLKFQLCKVISQLTVGKTIFSATILIVGKIWGFMAVTMKNAVFWDVSSRGYCKNPRFGGT